MLHFPENDLTEITQPHLKIYRNSREPWYVTAKRAQALQGMKEIHFWDDVNIQHAPDEKTPETTITTPSLTIFPNQQTAETADEITLMQPNLVVKALGMHADMVSGEIKLLANSRGEYVPN